MSKDAPQREHYTETPYISGARNLSNMGYENVANNLNRVNVFDKDTLANIQSNVNDIYRRAEDDFARNYNKTMRNLDTRNYNQFGTLNATAPSYVRDMQNLKSQRALMDSAYNKALYAEQLKDNELARRYKNLDYNENIFNKYGDIYSNFDWRNQDIDYQNAYSRWMKEQADLGNTLNAIGTIGSLALAPVTGGASLLATPLLSNIGNTMSSNPYLTSSSSLLPSSYGLSSGGGYDLNSALNSIKSASTMKL